MYYIGIDLGGTNIAAGLVEKSGKIISKISVKTEGEKGFDSIISKMEDEVKALIKNNNLTAGDIDGIGIGSPGSIDSKNGIVIYTNNIKLENAPMASALKDKTGIPVYISNDANCAALGEAVAGAAKEYKNALLVTLGTGVGGGIIIDGKIFDGSDGTGAEIGHTMLIMDGEPCTCGRNGCWEAYASATALIGQTKRAIEEAPDSLMASEAMEKGEVSGRTAFDCAKKGDAKAKQVVDNYLRYVAEGIIDFINVLRPEIVLIGGGISNEGDYIFVQIQDYINNNSYGSKNTKPPKVKRAELGNDAGIVGAAMLCTK